MKAGSDKPNPIREKPPRESIRVYWENNLPRVQMSHIQQLLDFYSRQNYVPSQREFQRTIVNASANLDNESIFADPTSRQECLELAQCALALHEFCVKEGDFLDGWLDQRVRYMNKLGPVPAQFTYDQWRKTIRNTFLFRRCTDHEVYRETYPILPVPTAASSGLWGILDTLPLTLDASEYMTLGRDLVRVASRTRG